MSPSELQRLERSDDGTGVDVVEHGCRLGTVERADDGGCGGADAVLEQDDEQAEYAEHAARHGQAGGVGGKREGKPDDAGDEQDDRDHAERHAGDHRCAVAGERGDLRGRVAGQGRLGERRNDHDDGAASRAAAPAIVLFENMGSPTGG